MPTSNMYVTCKRNKSMASKEQKHGDSITGCFRHSYVRASKHRHFRCDNVCMRTDGGKYVDIILALFIGVSP